MLKIRLLGQFDLTRNGVSIEIPSRSAQSLIAYLVLNSGISHRREMLAGLIWPDATESNVRSYLRKALWQARKSLATDNQVGEEYLIADDLSITFNSNAEYWLDVDALEESSIETTSTEDQIEAVSVYQGELLPGFYDEWITLERERVRAVFEHKIKELLDRLVEEGHWVETLDWGERWIALGSMPEPAYRALMIAYAALGDNAKVVGTYDRCVQTLWEELGVEPSEQTRELYEQIRSGKIKIGYRSPIPTKIYTDEIEIDSSPPETSHRRVANLPVPLTSFIGRKDEIKEIKHLILETRLLTLSGAGGSGKTRLAIQVANEIRVMFSDGIWWIDLAALTDPNLVPQTIAKVLHVREASHLSLMDSLANSLQAKEIMLVLDNCEHLLDACAQLGEYLLKACPNLKILTTSREVLGIAGERVFPVPTMSSPDPSRVDPSTFHTYDAVRLFVERAATQMPDFALTDQNALAIAQLLFELDGIPLAIELAAARVQALKVEQIAARLDDRFRLLTGGSRTALPRHQTLLATLDWSYDLLTSNEQTMLQRLSVFTGGWSVAAAENVCTGGGIQPEDLLDLLSLLANKSLVLIERRPGEEARYRMLETIREYAGVKLSEAGEETVVRDRHLEFFVKLAEVAEPQLSKPNQVSWFNRLEVEHENLRSAAVWSLERKATTPALSLVGSLSTFWYTHNHYYEARELSLQILSASFTRERTAARVKALNYAGLVQWWLERKADASPLLEEALEIATGIGDRSIIAWTRVNLGIVTSTQSDHQEGLSLMEQGLEEYKALDSASKYEVGFALTFLGDGYYFKGDYQHAQEIYETSVDVLSEMQDQNLLAYALRRLGYTARYRGDLEEAEHKYRQSLDINMKLEHKQAVAACITAFACIALDKGEAHIAVQLFSAVEKHLGMLGFWLIPSDSIEFERNLALARDELGEEEFATAWAEGRSMTTKQATALALNRTSPQE